MHYAVRSIFMVNTPFSVRVTDTQRILLIASPLAIGFLAPSLILLGVQTLVGGVPLGVAVTDIRQKQYAPCPNFFTLVGLIPFVVLALMLRAYTAHRTRRTCFAFVPRGCTGVSRSRSRRLRDG